MDIARDPQPYHERLLMQHLQAFLGPLDAPLIELLRQHLRWVEIAGGETLMRQGEPGDSMYLLVSGRLRTYIDDEDGTRRLVREISRGQIVGEISLYTGEPRSATLVAIRDSVLVRLAKADFGRLLASSPALSVALTKQLAVQLAKIGSVRVVDATAIERELRRERIVVDVGRGNEPDPEAQRHVALLLDEIEADNDFVLLVGDSEPSAWTRLTSRHCDELLLLADAMQPPKLHAIERECLMRRTAASEAAEILVLLHPPEASSPRGTREWLARRPVADHVHVRLGSERDMARLARIQSRTAVGLVFAGGGARGFAHLGVYRALRERGIEIDVVGGTSIGAVMAICVASDRPVDVVIDNARASFKLNPTGDYNLFPVLSLIKGRRLRQVVDSGIRGLIGFDADIEDLWKGFFCVTTNYSKASEQIVRHGNLVKSLLASVAIPGALPPMLHDGDLLCDGGTFNNFPVDVMQRMRGVGQTIGVDLDFRKPHRIELDEVPGALALLRDRLRPRSARRFRLPSLASYLMNVTTLYSMSRQRRAKRLADLYFNPPLDRVGMLEWNRFDAIVEQGYAHGRDVLARLGDEALRRFGAAGRQARRSTE
jgi:NTE family protein